MKPKVKHRRLKPHAAPELALLAEKVGTFIQYWGFKSVQGRIWLYLFVAKEPLSSIELSDLVKISPALVTQSVQVLLHYKVILLAPKGPNGVLRYEANPNVAEAILSVLESREAKLLGQTDAQLKRALSEARSQPKLGVALDPTRLELISGWLELFQSLLAMGMIGLNSKETPFSHPSDYIGRIDRI